MKITPEMQRYVYSGENKFSKTDPLDPSLLKKRIELYGKLFDSLFNPTKIEESLDNQLTDTLDTLVWATQMGFLTLRNEQGKEIWRGIFNYIKEHDFSDLMNQQYKERGFLEESQVKNKILYELRGGLYSSAHGGRYVNDYLLTEGLGMLITGLTAGRVQWYVIAKSNYERIVRRFFKEIGLWKIVKEDNLAPTIPRTS